MMRNAKGARRYNYRITLTMAEAVRDEFGHASFAEPVKVLEVFAEVLRQAP